MIINLQNERIKRKTQKTFNKIGLHSDGRDYKEKLIKILQSSKNKLNIIENLYNDFSKNVIEEENSLLFLTFLIQNLQKIITAIESSREDPIDEDELEIIMKYLNKLKIRMLNTYIRDNYINS
ncbi:hypothetical protein K8M07_12125 [Schnuerera sp. xch1]|uniref:hypothetical protein n=1 Tax=Schnuerera sp. xch1 TaxID=2874283 RepID=UPI001CBD2707|nr:hypothetical protein [Schnuerera sp. xch1]MBZ2175986.1 hypothetical protein [Schnuerera sp. xch1]